jgi:hypothetical protein
MISDLQKAIWNQQSQPEHLYRDVQSRAETVLQALGDSAPPPAIVQGESLQSYRRRLADRLRVHSPRWGGHVALDHFSGAALDEVENQIYADALAASRDPARVPAGTLRESIEVDRTGRRITRFVGDPENCWGAFKMPIKRILGIAGERR